MKLKAIGCLALLREACHFIARSKHVIDLEFFDFAQHNDPAAMRVDLQRRIDATECGDYDAIVLIAGLCGHGSAGLTARSIPVVIPRADDCIVLLMGSRARYDADHKAVPGTYYLTPGFLEHADLGAEGIGSEALRRIRLVYVEKYGQDNADYLMSVLHSWQNSYSRACLIDTRVASTEVRADYRRRSREIAMAQGWQFDEIASDNRLLRRLFAGDWHDNRFVVVPPGKSLQPSNDARVMKAE